ncbi:hypothetical protein QOZ80_7BG0586000 [Eleusine coracana subsp. coracana]|nr:hypothetical protein QOZ80_7BG0586000 [Eleusine coracana subsp. coracana]
MAPRSFQTLTMDVLCYSETKKNLPNGRCVESGVLVAGGYSWRIGFYPNGNIASTTDAASVSLLFADAAGEDVDVVCHLSRFVKHKDLDKSVFAKHDRFTIRCDLAVVPSTSTTEGLLLAADRYNLKDLKALIEKMMCEHVRVSTVLPMLALAEQHKCLKLKEKCLGFMASYWNARETMRTGDVEHLARSCPSVVKEAINKMLDGREEDRKDSFISNLVFIVFFMAIMFFFNVHLLR